MHIHISWANHDAPWMLTGGILYFCKACRQPFDKAPPFLQVISICIFVSIADGCFIGNGTDGTCPKYIVSTEQFFRVLMGSALIISREVQVNIWYLVPMETHKNSKWNIVAIGDQWRSTVRTITPWQVESSCIFPFQVELAPLTFWAYIMWFQWIYFRYICHGGYERRTYGATRPYEVAIV